MLCLLIFQTTRRCPTIKDRLPISHTKTPTLLIMPNPLNIINLSSIPKPTTPYRSLHTALLLCRYLAPTPGTSRPCPPRLHCTSRNRTGRTHWAETVTARTSSLRFLRRHMQLRSIRRRCHLYRRRHCRRGTTRMGNLARLTPV